jgi:hypothetical protein
MKKQIISEEFKRMQKLAGIIQENTEILKEAYDVYPTSEEEIEDSNIKKLFTFLKDLKPEIETPIALDNNKPKFIKISSQFEKDKTALNSLSNFTNLDFNAYAKMLKTKNYQERQRLTSKERLNWNGINILFGSGAKDIPQPRKQDSIAKGWEGSRKNALRAIMINTLAGNN